MLEFKPFVRKPFIVEAVQITEDNIEEIAKLVGELKYKDGEPFIFVNQNIVPGLARVQIGFLMTRFGENLRCYNPRAFAHQFANHSESAAEWVEFINDKKQAAVWVTETEPEVPQNVAEPAPEEVPSG